MEGKDKNKDKKIINYDPRMTEESRKFVKIYLRFTNKLFKKINLKDLRSILDASTFALNDSMAIENIIEKEFFVKNKNDGYEVPVSAYIPKDTKPNSPIVVYFHGGGGIICSRKTHYHSIASLASKSKCIWLSVEYRLAPEYKFPIFLDDCLSVVKWVAENKVKTFNCDKNAKIGIGGDSAGGTIAASVAHELRNIVDFQILIYPCVLFNTSYNSYKEFQDEIYLLTPKLLDFFALSLLNDTQDLESPRLVPMLNKDFTKLPNSLIVSAELDPLVDDSREYHKKLTENQNKSELYIIKGVQHGFFNMPGVLPNAFSEASDHILNFLSRYCINENLRSKL